MLHTLAVITAGVYLALSLWMLFQCFLQKNELKSARVQNTPREAPHDCRNCTTGCEAERVKTPPMHCPRW